MKTRKLIFAVLLSALLGACAHWDSKAKVHPAKETVLFDGLEFKVNSREYRYTPLPVSGKAVAPEDLFLIIELSLRNSYSMPVPVQFQPRFMLVGKSGAEYAPEKELSFPSANGGPSELAPKTAYTRRLVFDVPEGEYRLRVFTPVVVKTGPEGGLQGRFFYYDIGPLR
jgi:hypothetical protein